MVKNMIKYDSSDVIYVTDSHVLIYNKTHDKVFSFVTNVPCVDYIDEYYINKPFRKVEIDGFIYILIFQTNSQMALLDVNNNLFVLELTDDMDIHIGGYYENDEILNTSGYNFICVLDNVIIFNYMTFLETYSIGPAFSVNNLVNEELNVEIIKIEEDVTCDVTFYNLSESETFNSGYIIISDILNIFYINAMSLQASDKYNIRYVNRNINLLKNL